MPNGGVKHVLESIRAFYELHSKYPDWKLELVGSGYLEEDCKNLIIKLGAKEYITVFGWLNKDRVISVTNEWKYNMLTSDHEGLPNSMIELMGKGVPMIATPVGGIPDLLKDNVNGFVLNGVTVATIKEGLERAITASNYEQLTRSAFDTVSERFSMEGAKIEAGELLSSW